MIDASSAWKTLIPAVGTIIDAEVIEQHVVDATVSAGIIRMVADENTKLTIANDGVVEHVRVAGQLQENADAAS